MTTARWQNAHQFDGFHHFDGGDLDCGFSCFAKRCANDARTAFEKIKRIVQSAEILRERYGY